MAFTAIKDFCPFRLAFKAISDVWTVLKNIKLKCHLVAKVTRSWFHANFVTAFVKFKP